MTPPASPQTSKTASTACGHQVKKSINDKPEMNGEGDLVGSALAPPSSSVGDGNDHADDGAGFSAVSDQLPYRPGAGTTHANDEHADEAQPNQVATVDRDAASTFFSEASASDQDGLGGWGGDGPSYYTTEDDGTLRGIDVDISKDSRYRSPTRPGRAGRVGTPSGGGGTYSPTNNPVFSPGAMSSPGNTSLSSTNLSPHQQKRYGGAGGAGRSGANAHTIAYHRHRPPVPPDIMTQSGMLLGSDMMVPTLGVPVPGQQSTGKDPSSTTKTRDSYRDMSLQNGPGRGAGHNEKNNRSASATPTSSSDTDGQHHLLKRGGAGGANAKGKRTSGSSGGSNTSGAPGSSAGIFPFSGTGIGGITLPSYSDMAFTATLQGGANHKGGHRRKRSWSSGGKGKNAVPAHRRTRSGDAKAAGLLTGGVGDWKGMELDQLPLPEPIRWTKSASAAVPGQKQQHQKEQQLKLSARIGSAPSLSAATGTNKDRTNATTSIQQQQQRHIITSPRKAAAADARRILEARYGTALMGRSDSRQSMGYSETDESEIDAGGPPLHDGTRRSPTKAASASGYSSASITGAAGGGSGLTRPFSPASNADLSETTQESNSNHSLFSWISGRFSVVSGKSKSGLAKLRSSRSNRSNRSGSSRTFGSSLGMSGISEGSSFSPTNNADLLTEDLNRSSGLQRLGENAPLLEHASSSTTNHSSSDRTTSSNDDDDNGGESSPFEDPNNDLFRQRKVMMQIGTERESPDLNKTERSFKSTLSRPSFGVPEHEADKFPTFVCPNCRTRQRNFFTVSSAPRQFESPAGYLAFYMAIYVVASLFIFGLEEGWPALDCVYFAVITLTTAGLGDYVPSTDGAKIICSVFIYFGVACIGLLLGSLLASGLDDASRKRARETMVNDCPNCARLEAQKRMLDVSRRSYAPSSFSGAPSEHKTWYSERSNDGPGVVLNHQQISPTANTGANNVAASRGSSGKPPNGRTARFDVPVVNNNVGGSHPLLQSPPPTYAGENTPLGYSQTAGWGGQTYNAPYTMSPFGSSNAASAAQQTSMQYGLAQTISPVPSNVMSRQSHTRHMSFDIQNMANTPAPPIGPSHSRNFSVDVQATPGLPMGGVNGMSQTLNSTMPTPDGTDYAQAGGAEEEDYSDSYSTSSASSGESSEGSYESSESEYDPMVPLSKVQSAKYVFLTLRQALANSVFIIAIGGFGFYFIERMTAVDAFYFTTVLLTTVGYGDIVPQTSEGKMFATVYVLIAGTVLLHNMSTISMIPIELRKRRVERAVLRQFGNQLDDAALRELATGPLVKRLQLSATRADGLDECTREMFALAMLVRLGRISEQDVRSTFDAFRRLDVDDDGVLNSRDIIIGEFQRRQTILRQSRSQADLQSVDRQQHPKDDGNNPPSGVPSNSTGSAGVELIDGRV